MALHIMALAKKKSSKKTKKKTFSNPGLFISSVKEMILLAADGCDGRSDSSNNSGDGSKIIK